MGFLCFLLHFFVLGKGGHMLQGLTPRSAAGYVLNQKPEIRLVQNYTVWYAFTPFERQVFSP